MPWYAAAVCLWLALNVFFGLALAACSVWEAVLDRRAARRQDDLWAAEHGIDLSYTCKPTFLGARR